MGKSAFALNIATNAAVQAKVPVVIFNLEMSKSQLVNRILCSEAMVDSNKIRTGKIEEDDWVKLATALGPLSEAPIYIDDTPGITVTEIRAKCRKLKLEKNIGLIVIDYLQLLKSKNKFGNREQEVADISRRLKLLTKKLDIPIVALCQLNRETEKRKTPILADLRESGSLEQDADNVIFLYIADDEKNKSKIINIDVIVAKQRNGPTGTVRIEFNKKQMKFENVGG